MNLTKALNVCIAVLRGDTRLAREELRAPGSEVKDVPAVVGKLIDTVEQVKSDAIVAELKEILIDSLRLGPGRTPLSNSELHCYVTGINDVEQLINARIETRLKRYAPATTLQPLPRCGLHPLGDGGASCSVCMKILREGIGR